MNKFSSPAVGTVAVTDKYFAPRIAANHTATIPASLKFSRDTGRIEAFKLKWKKGMPKEPHIFWDSDVAKVVEGMAYDLVLNPGDRKLAKELDKIVALIVSAQQPDGYLNTHFTVVEPENRFKWLNSHHELYCCGHLIEAAVAHFEATGKRDFLDCMCRYADYLASVFGRGKGQKRGYPGHEEIELALVKLASVTGEKRYFKLAQYFIEERGRKPNYYVKNEGAHEGWLSNIQAEATVRERKEAVGHSVRMMYLACGMADVASLTDDAELLDRCRVRRQKRNLLAPLASLDGIEPFHGVRKARMGRETIDGIRGDDRHATGVQNRRRLVEGRLCAGKNPHASFSSRRLRKKSCRIVRDSSSSTPVTISG